MKIIKPSYNVISVIPGNGYYILKDLEEVARTCYKSEDKITENPDSAIKLIGNLVKNGHEAMLEFFDITVKFICDRGVSHELVRHRLCSFSQESTRYCNYAQGKFGSEITVIEPVIFEEISQERKNEIYEYAEKDEIPGGLSNLESAYAYWCVGGLYSEIVYMNLVDPCKIPPEIARSVLPTCLKTEINMKANLREWRHILELRTSERAHPEMRRLMIPLLFELHDKIPIIFDDIFEKVKHTAVK